MADQGTAAACQPNVELKSVAAVLESEIEGSKTILRNRSERAGTSMTEKEGDIGHRGWYCNASILGLRLWITRNQ